MAKIWPVFELSWRIEFSADFDDRHGFWKLRTESFRFSKKNRFFRNFDPWLGLQRKATYFEGLRWPDFKSLRLFWENPDKKSKFWKRAPGWSLRASQSDILGLGTHALAIWPRNRYFWQFFDFPGKLYSNKHSKFSIFANYFLLCFKPK